MTKRKYTEEEQKMFNYERFNHPHPRVQLKMEVLFLKSKKLRTKEIASLANISENTVRKYIYEYEEGGLEKLKEINFYKPKSELSKYEETSEDYFQKNPPMTIKEAVAKIEEMTGLKRSETQVRTFLKRIGFTRLKVGYIPGKADIEAQKEYQEKELFPQTRRG